MRDKIFKHDDDDPSPLGLYYNAWFNSKTDCTELDNRYKRALIKFPIIFSSSELSTYKICHHFYQTFGMRSSDIKTVDGLAIESYLDPFVNHKYNIIRMEELVKDGVLRDISGKWLVIPNMNSQWSPRLAYLFYDTVKNAESLGIIFHSEGGNNFGKVLVEQTFLDVLQFPEKLYDRQKQLPDDRY